MMHTRELEKETEFHTRRMQIEFFQMVVLFDLFFSDFLFLTIQLKTNEYEIGKKNRHVLDRDLESHVTLKVIHFNEPIFTFNTLFPKLNTGALRFFH